MARNPITIRTVSESGESLDAHVKVTQADALLGFRGLDNSKIAIFAKDPVSGRTMLNGETPLEGTITPLDALVLLRHIDALSKVGPEGSLQIVFSDDETTNPSVLLIEGGRINLAKLELAGLLRKPFETIADAVERVTGSAPKSSE